MYTSEGLSLEITKNVVRTSNNNQISTIDLSYVKDATGPTVLVLQLNDKETGIFKNYFFLSKSLDNILEAIDALKGALSVVWMVPVLREYFDLFEVTKPVLLASSSNDSMFLLYENAATVANGTGVTSIPKVL